LFQITHTAILLVLLSADFTLGGEKQVKLEDIERDNLETQQPQQQQQQGEAKPSVLDYTGHQQLNYQAQQQQQEEVKPSVLDYTRHQQLNYRTQQQQEVQPSVLDYTGHRQLNYRAQQQIPLQPPGYLHGLQPQVQFQAPPTAGAVALYLAGNGLVGNYLGLTPELAYQSVPQQIYLHQGGYPGLQFVQVPPSPFIYSHQPESRKPPEIVHSPIQKETQTAAPEANPISSHSSDVAQSAYQRPSAASANTNFVYTPQQAYNPIPKELQSYTTIPHTVYQGKEPDFLYDQQPSVSLTHGGLNQYNTLYQQPKHQRPILSSGVKSAGLSSPKTFSNDGRFLTPARHLPGPGLSYSSYRQGPGAF
jgi:hypothetical protein